MSRRKPPLDPTSPWLITLQAIAAYAGESPDTVNAALLSGAMQGRQARPGAKWRSKREWVDAWIDGFGSVAS